MWLSPAELQATWAAATALLPTVLTCFLPFLFGFSPQVERDERSDAESEVDDNDEEEPEEDGDECSWEQRKGAINSKLASLANNCVLNNLTHQRNINSRMPKAR